MSKVVDYFLKYVAFDTQSAEDAGTVPSTEKQFALAKLLSEHVHSACGGPFVRNFRHGGGRRNGVNGRNFAECVCNVRRGGITVDCHFFHSYPPNKIFLVFKSA